MEETNTNEGGINGMADEGEVGLGDGAIGVDEVMRNDVNVAKTRRKEIMEKDINNITEDEWAVLNARFYRDDGKEDHTTITHDNGGCGGGGGGGGGELEAMVQNIITHLMHTDHNITAFNLWNCVLDEDTTTTI